MAVASPQSVKRRTPRPVRALSGRPALPGGPGGLATLCLGIAVVLLVTLTGGCSRPVAARDTGPAMVPAAERGLASDAALFGTDDLRGVLASRGVTEDDAAMAARRDGVLVARAPVSTFEQDAWRTPTRPTLARSGRVLIQRQPDTVIFFRDEQVRERTTTGAWWGR